MALPKGNQMKALFYINMISALFSVSVSYRSVVSMGCTRRSFCFVMTRRRRMCCSCCAPPLRSRRETWWRPCCQVRQVTASTLLCLDVDVIQCRYLQSKPPEIHLEIREKRRITRIIMLLSFPSVSQ